MLVVSLLIIYAANGVAAAVTKTYSSNIDAAIEYYNQWGDPANTNYGNDIHLAIGNSWMYGEPLDYYWRWGSLIYFNTGSDLNGKTILSATLRLYVYATAIQKDGRYVVYPIAQTWNEGTVTWNNSPTWWLAPNREASAPQTNDEYTEWDVTEIVQYWASGARANYGFYVEDVKVPDVCYMCADNQITEYFSSDYGNAAYWPKLVVTYPCANKPVKVGNDAAAFDYIQDAYNAAASPQTIRAQAVTLGETLNFSVSKIIDLRGGYDCDFVTQSGFTTINGSLTIKAGTITVGNVIIN